MRRCGSTEQCLWLGPHRHLCSCSRRFANADADSDVHTDGLAFSDDYREPDANSNGNGNSHTFRHTYSYTTWHADAQAASHSRAASVRAKAIYLILDGCWYVVAGTCRWQPLGNAIPVLHCRRWVRAERPQNRVDRLRRSELQRHSTVGTAGT